MEKVITTAVNKDVAIEVDTRCCLAGIQFIKWAKAAGVKFAFGTNNGDRDLGGLA